ncbi:carbohydrate kinase family protein [Acidisoma cellulosilytica]|uniref:Carbohydrate kinase family protein n=1 Tax=Acidisoma cellulosilyticum TaxID=2802395 RepID=A0A964E4A2_9PROT|nr:carbohydrate kinase family protein [Acidisoma cellulosilyticum]MCB8881072.1 carbohydrate kinase family protein [Acidisoma cellulosilyticum]
MKPSAALFVGDGSWDTTQRIPRLPGVDEKVNSTAYIESSGGVAANAAAACARVGTVSRALIRLGQDDAADWIKRSLTEAGVSMVADQAEGSTTRATILLEPHGEKRLLLFDGTGLYPSVEAVAAVDLSDIGWVHTTLYYPDSAAILIARCRAAKIPVSIDLEPGSFANLSDVAPLIDGSAVVFSNNRTEERLGDAVTALLAVGAQAIVRTKGADGASWHDGTVACHVTAPRGDIVDTTGAGDCLAGWFVGERLAGQQPLDALTRAVHAASLSCGGLGSARAYPSRHDVETSLTRGLL